MHKFVLSKSCSNCTWVLYKPNFKNLIKNINFKITVLGGHNLQRNLIILYKLVEEMEIYNEGKYLKLQCFFALSNASDVFWLKWQITRQHYGNLNDFLLNNNNNNFWQPQKILWQNVLAKLIRIVYVSKHSNICISRNSYRFIDDSSYIFWYYRYIFVKGQWRVTNLLRCVIKVILLLLFGTKETTLLGPLQAM